MGKGLERISRARRGKLPVVIPEGRIRPLVPLVAAKFSTECNIAVRNHVPVFKHWKDYKKQSGIHKQFLGALAVSAYSRPLHLYCLEISLFGEIEILINSSSV